MKKKKVESKEEIEYIYDEEKVFGVVEKVVLEDILGCLTGYVFEKFSICTKMTEDKHPPYFHSVVEMVVKFNPLLIVPASEAANKPVMTNKDQRYLDLCNKAVLPRLNPHKESQISFLVAFSRDNEQKKEIFSMGKIQKIA